MPWLFAGEWVVQVPDRPGSIVVESIEEQARYYHGRDYLGMAVSTLERTGNKEPGKVPKERGGWIGPSKHEVVPSIHLYTLSLSTEKWLRSSEPAVLLLFGVSYLSFPLKPSLG